MYRRGSRSRGVHSIFYNKHEFRRNLDLTAELSYSTKEVKPLNIDEDVRRGSHSRGVSWIFYNNMSFDEVLHLPADVSYYVQRKSMWCTQSKNLDDNV